MTKRLFYLDLLRVFAISAVILLHCINTLVLTPWMYGTTSWNIAVVLNEISRAGVPLFLMISGYLMLCDERSADFAFFYKKRLPRIIIPLVVWCAIYYAIDALCGKEVSIGGFFAALLNNGTTYHMWFVYMLAGIYLVTPFLKRLVDTLTEKQLILLTALILFPTAIRPLINIATPVYVNLFETPLEGYLGFFFVGYLLGKTSLKGASRIIILLGGIVGGAIGIIGNIRSCDGVTMGFTFNGGYMINHYLVAASLFVLARTVDEKFGAPNDIRKITAKLSDISFGVYWIHVLIISVTVKFVSINTSPIVQCCVHFILVLSVSFVIMLAASLIKPLKRFIM